MFRFYIFIASLLLLSSCSDDQEDVVVNIGYDYFPVKVGSYHIYEVDSIYHDNPIKGQTGIHDTSFYYVKEVVESEFVDAQEEPGFRIERFKRESEEDPWVLVDIWASKMTNTNAQRLEEDLRYIRLVFPVSLRSQWDGNALNSLNEWTHAYSNIDEPFLLDTVQYMATVRVKQREFFSLFDDELAYEVYARDIGLIEKYFKDLDTRQDYVANPVAEEIRQGVEYRYKLIEYGEE